MRHYIIPKLVKAGAEERKDLADALALLNKVSQSISHSPVSLFLCDLGAGAVVHVCVMDRRHTESPAFDQRSYRDKTD